MNDKKLIKLLKEKHEDSIDALITSYGKLIYAVINSLLYLPEEIEERDECFNEVLLTLWTYIGCYDESKGQLSNYIISVARYKAIDTKRKLSKHNKKEELDENIQSLTIPMEEEIISKDNFNSLIKVLDEDDRKLFIERYILFKSIEDIAAEQKQTKSAIYSRLSRGREKIRKRLEVSGL